MLDLPASPGAYVLELYLPADVDLAVGRLGVASLPASVLFYLGSAHGPGGLKARLGRHLQPGTAKPPHWHIDYLRRIAQVRAFAYVIQPEIAAAVRLECMWSRALACLPGSCVPLSGFGASDCRLGCPAHLIAFPAEKQDPQPLLDRSVWLQALERVAGSPLVTSPSPG